MELYTDEKVVMSQLTLPKQFSSWANVVHGGILATLLDEIMGWAGLYLLRQITLTKNMTVEFSKAAYVGETLKVVGSVVKKNGKRNVEIEGIITRDNGEVCARSRGNFTILSSKLAVRLGIITDEQLQNFFEPLFQQIPGNHD
jgi:uncharacterized protein (TIGR00369 family)